MRRCACSHHYGARDGVGDIDAAPIERSSIEAASLEPVITLYTTAFQMRYA